MFPKSKIIGFFKKPLLEMRKVSKTWKIAFERAKTRESVYLEAK